MSRSVADTIVETLAAAGVRHAFGVPGDAINAIVDATRRNDDVEFVHVRHEEAGAFAASAQAKLTGRPSAVYGTSGPGTIHLLNGLYDAKLDHAPVIAVTGQAPTARLGTQAHQEIDQHELFSGLAVFSRTLSSADQLPALAVEAAQAALTGRGVAHLAVPSDLAQQDVPGDGIPRIVQREPRTRPAGEDLDEAVALLHEASAPTILLGIGARDAVPQVLELAERLGAPIVKSLKAKALVDDEHPLTTGGHGLLGTRASVNAMRRCDLLLMLGTDYPYRDFYPDDVPVVQVDVERSRIGRRTDVTVGLVGHADLVLDDLLERVGRNDDRSALEDAQQDMQRWCCVTPARSRRGSRGTCAAVRASSSPCRATSRRWRSGCRRRWAPSSRSPTGRWSRSSATGRSRCCPATS
jgi:thiamine pyrophosphate-dependent acetolactate synthase large subunit-like protein